MSEVRPYAATGHRGVRAMPRCFGSRAVAPLPVRIRATRLNSGSGVSEGNRPVRLVVGRWAGIRGDDAHDDRLRFPTDGVHFEYGDAPVRRCSNDAGPERRSAADASRWAQRIRPQVAHSMPTSATEGIGGLQDFMGPSTRDGAKRTTHDSSVPGRALAPVSVGSRDRFFRSPSWASLG